MIENNDDPYIEEPSEMSLEHKIIVDKLVREGLDQRKGMTDWTMDIPKINYDIDENEEEEDEDEEIDSQNQDEEDNEIQESNNSLIKVEDIALSEDNEK